MLDRILAGRRRRRAERVLEFGKPVGLDFEFQDAGPVHLDVIFQAEGATLFMKVIDLKPIGTGATGMAERRPVGVKNVIDCCREVERLAADAGYERLRISGKRRSHRRDHMQTLEFDLTKIRERDHGHR